ncbi:MAG: hypothetical protein WBP61_05370 [Nocardioides sp.]
MDLYTSLTPFILTFVAIAAIAAVVSVGVLAEFVVGNRRERLTRHQSIRTYYRGLTLAH